MRSDEEILMTIKTYLSAMYKSKKRLDGIVYITPITDTRMSGSAVRNLDMVSVFVGDKALSEVVLVTSKWDLVVDLSVAEDREKALREKLWKPFIDKGSRVCRLDLRRLMALHVLDVLLPRVEVQGKVVLQIQHELIDDTKTLDETEAGRQLSKEILKMQEAFRRKLDEMMSELNDAITARDADMQKDLREEQARLKRTISQAEYASLIHQMDQVGTELETKEIEGLVRIEKLISEIEAGLAQVLQN